MYVQQFVQTDYKDTSKVRVTVPLWGNPSVTGRSTGTKTRKMFPLDDIVIYELVSTMRYNQNSLHPDVLLPRAHWCMRTKPAVFVNDQNSYHLIKLRLRISHWIIMAKFTLGGATVVALSQYKEVFLGVMLRQSCDSLIFIMWIAILVRRYSDSPRLVFVKMEFSYLQVQVLTHDIITRDANSVSRVKSENFQSRIMILSMRSSSHK